MKTTNFLLTLALLVSTVTFAQVGIGTDDPHPSAILEVDVTSLTDKQGFLPPRTTPGEIINPAEGLVIYNNSSQCLEVFNGTAWVSLCDGTLIDPLTTVIGANGLEWMDRNLGASQVATSSTDAASYGDLYQWGRAADGHEKIFRVTGDDPTSSNYTNELNGVGVANFDASENAWDGQFITRNSGVINWVDPSVSGVDDLWQGVNGINNPCPSGYRLPTETELNNERLSWAPNNNREGAIASPLKLPVAGGRGSSNGSLFVVDTGGLYWSSTVSSTNSRFLDFDSSNATMTTFSRAVGLSVRCLKD